jgi:RNA polymerase sigma-70 factor, ECF subfamily
MSGSTQSRGSSAVGVVMARRVVPRTGRSGRGESSGASDPDLVGAIADGDERALAEVHQRYAGAVWAVAQRVCGDRAAAEDVCQTVFVDLWSRPERFDPERGKLRSWLVAQAHARAVDVVRSETARQRRQQRVARLAPTPPPSGDVEAASLLASLADHVRRALDRLTADDRDAIVLAYFGGHSYRETAALLGAPEGTVKSRIRRGLESLRHVLEAEGVTP